MGQGQSSGIAEGGNPEPPAPMSEEQKQAFSSVQQWVVNTALQIDQNQEAEAPPVVEMVIEVPDALPPVQQAQHTIEAVLNALQASGIELTQEIKEILQEQLQQILPEISPQTQQIPGPNPPGPEPGNETSVSHINYSSPGTYGPASAENRQSIGKNVIVSAAGVTLRNMIISKDLTLAAGIGDGSVTLKNVKVQRDTKILGGVAIILSGDFATVNISASGVHIQIEGSIAELKISSTAERTTITGTGQILNAIINANGVEMEKAPLNWSTATGISFTVAGQSRSGSSASNAKLFSLSLDTGVLSPAFSPDTDTYTASVGNSVYEVTVTAIPQENTATVEVNGSETETYLQTLVVGSNPIEILVTAQDGSSLGYNLAITRAASSLCEITGVNTPSGASINGTDITASVGNEITSLTVDAVVSANATWKLYSDSGYVNEIASKQMNLVVGANYGYIKVTAQNGVSEGYYNLVINRLSNDATVATVGSCYIVDNTACTITAVQTIINTNITVETFLANLTKQDQASWKVVATGTTISNPTEFDTAISKSSSATLIFNDMLAVKAGDGTIKIYTITVILGDPVLGISGGLGYYDSVVYKNPSEAFTWGLYRYWIFDSYENRYWIGIIAYDQSNQIAGTWQKSSNPYRYHTGISLDIINRMIKITTSEGSGTFDISWNDVLITQP